MNELHESSAAYALNALDPAEVEEFEAHLATCAACRAEVAELQAVAADLALLGDEVPAPPASLRAAVLSGIADVEQLPPLPGRPRRALPGSEPEDEPEVGTVSEAVGPIVDELALRRASRRARVLSVLVAAVTVVALALGGVVWSLVRQDQNPPTAGQQLPGVDPALLSAPDAKIYPATLPSGAQVSFVVSKQRNAAAFVGSDLPSPGAGNVYHLWTLKGQTPRPDRTLTGGSDSTQAFSGPIDDSTALAVNIERAGTDPQAPTTDVLGLAKI